jgi:mRNA-degrading endonuclease RelE of RelBE toxin-antitoxin system
MDRIEKLLAELNAKERKNIKEILTQLAAGFLKSLDIKKLQGRKSVFRVRKGQLRIIFTMNKSIIKILTIERRTDHTYKNL